MMDTEEVLYADRAALRRLVQTQPAWTQGALAAHLGRAVSWVKKWTKRLRVAPPDDTQVLWSRSRAHRTPYPCWDDGVVARILAIRDQPPDGLRRIPGPRAILYYLGRDPTVREQGAALPRSTGAVWRILKRQGRIVHTRRPDHEPVERPAPLTSGQLDFKDASTVAVEPEGKRGHTVEVLNTLDVGTSALLGANVRADYTAETSLRAVAELVRELMTPKEIQQLPEGLLIVNTLHARPVLARALPWYRVRSLRRIVALAHLEQARQPSAPQESRGAEAAATAPRA